MTSPPFWGRRLAVVSVGLALAVALAPAPAPAHVPPSRVAPVVPDVEGTAVRGEPVRQVLAISLDGFNVDVLTTLGRTGAPHLHRLFRTGASTRNARTQVEMTKTLPNHTSQLTGRRIDATEGGHGVTWNTHVPGTTIQGDGAGAAVDSIFTQVRLAGRTSALFATEEKFSLFKRSWPRAVNRSTIVQDGDRAVTLAARRDQLRRNRAFTFLHLGAMDEAGHDRGWLSRRYLRAARLVDEQIGILLRAIREHRRLHDVVIVLTADHGGAAGAKDHSEETKYANYRIPFLIWGPTVDRGNLYPMNPTYADPRRARILFEDTQPIRNGDLANLSAGLLGLDPVPGSLWGFDQRLAWHR